VRAIADEQWGLITKQQIAMTGIAGTTVTRQLDGGSLERVARGVYRVRGGNEPDHLELRAAWLQLEPAVPAWERTAATGAVSHRSAAELYGIGHLPADRYEFTLPVRRQTRRDDVRLHRAEVVHDCITLRGLPVTRPSRIAADLLADREDPGAVAQLIVEALRSVFDYAESFASAIAPYASAYGLPRRNGIALLRWLLELSGDPGRHEWLAEAATADEGASARMGASQ
jgi:predicted transcriptional regulator of viral defense system